ncbi:hypothetical protein FGKAn22_15910 [Ferrigenium kumadai]|uniref:EAL domain-containing protein n=1 Tax=Ferrigenium kumadai TaxID=1682490 RepID=A0AAN1SZD2_9PROT|nr:EAL domain-containing protein [Ferrigenium kumadai]BBI99898.1 hypothetical protein FGKAn22_15910 [Ferrigenium kumadai]
MDAGTTPPITLVELAKGLAHDEFVFYYQPKVSLVGGKVNGAEALIRWKKPDGTIIPPDEFIPIAESTGFITEISRAMFPKLVADMLILNDMDASISIAFNLSSKDFESPEMLELIRSAIESHQIDPDKLQVELTEAAIIDINDPNIRNNLNELVKLGVKLAMDDYGTGYSSIDTLSQWPFSVVKIDQGLIRRMVESEKSTTIVQASIRMAHQLGINVVAEGIESANVYDFLLHAGCTDAQGFWLAQPMPLAELLAFIRSDRRWSALPAGLIHMAQLDHIHWRKTLIDQVTTLAFNHSKEKSVQGVSAEQDPHRCKLGVWYYGLGQEFKGISTFDELEEPHRLLHEQGAKLIEAARNGSTREEITNGLRELTKLSSIVLGLLQELENEAFFQAAEQNG